MDPDATPPAPAPVPPAAADVRFPALYGAEPDAVWAAPGRVNLIGEHTDYNGGLALPFAIDRAARAAVRALPGARTVRVATSWGGATAEHPSSPHPPPPGEPSPGILELALDQLADIEPDRVPPWARFPVGVARELLRRGVPVPPFELLLDSDVPVGAGLSSSAAIGCSVALALDELAHAGSSRRDLADVCRAAENDFVGAPTGIMDQSASLLATEDHALLLDCRTGESRAVALRLQAAGLVLLVVDTKVSHEHGTGGYADRVDSCQQAARALGVASLREVAADQLPRAAALLDAETFRRLRHVVTENDRVRAVARALDHLATAPAEASGRWTEVGRLLTAGHASLRDDYAVSCAELDLAVDSALAAGALGARMTGGGFGGSAIVLARENDAGAVTTAVRRAFAEAGFASPAVFPVRPGPGAHRL